MTLPGKSFWERYPLAAPVLAWLSGLACGKVLGGSEKLWLSVSAVTWLILLFLFILKSLRARFIFPVFALVFMFTTGVAAIRITSPGKEGRWLDRHLPEEPVWIKFRVIKPVQSTPFYLRYQAFVIQTDSLRYNYGIFVKIPKHTGLLLESGREYVYRSMPGEFQTFPPPPYPYAFNYKEYAASKNLFRILKLKDSTRLKSLRTSGTYQSFIYKLHSKIKNHWQTYGLNKSTASLASALLLGERQWLDRNTKQQFIDAGIMHVLAISGLHIGILLLFFRLLFRPFRHKKILYHSLIIISLWLYAAFTGFPPSVLRAVIMFSFLQVSYSPERKFSGFYALLLAAFIMTVFDPQYIYNPGFQLSFFAVASILWFYPLLRKIYYPKSKVSRYLIDLIYVSLAAQPGVLPLVLFYFHRFSFVFIIANILVIPLVTIIIFTGVLSILSALFQIHIPFLVPFLNFLLKTLLQTTEALAANKSLIYNNIPVTAMQFGALTVLILGWTYFFYSRNKKAFFWATAATAFAIWTDNLDLYLNQQKHSAYWSQYNNHPMLILRNGDRLTVYARRMEDAIPVKEAFQNQARIKTSQIMPIPFAFQWQNQTVTIADTSYNPLKIPRKTNILVLNGTVKTHLEALLDTIRPEFVILSGYRPLWLDQKWKTDLNKSGIPYRDLRIRGYTDFWLEKNRND